MSAMPIALLTIVIVGIPTTLGGGGECLYRGSNRMREG
jgi:hypothetical protein